MALAKAYDKAEKETVQPYVIVGIEDSTWRKPATIVERPRPKLGGAFNLTLTSLPKKGGAA